MPNSVMGLSMEARADSHQNTGSTQQQYLSSVVGVGADVGAVVGVVG